MSLHQDLLDQARFLARRESRRPKQASLRRAISTAYYAIFHLLISEASGLVVDNKRVKATLNRIYTHAEMAKVAKAFSAGTLPRRLQPLGTTIAIPLSLRTTAQIFVNLQQARHDADYDTAKPFTRNEALALINRAEQAFRNWATVRKEDCARLFLASFLVWDRWDKA